jgi:hypothetical protein
MKLDLNVKRLTEQFFFQTILQFIISALHKLLFVRLDPK